MLDDVLNILGIIGIVLLVILGILLVLLFIILFLPIRYWIDGEKDEESFLIRARARWLFGLLRLRALYPEPGNVIIKLLWITLYDSAAPKKENTSESEENVEGATEQTEINADAIEEDGTEAETNDNENLFEALNESETYTESAEQEKENKEKKENFFVAKYHKIKYTILKFYDKIKHIWENVSFYRNLLQEEETKSLIQHVLSRIGKILKSIRPRKLKTNIVFGATSPDTTGYIYALYGMLSPNLGKHVIVTPDFTQAILQGELHAAGNITLFQLLYHSLRVVFDKRLKRLIAKIKKHNKKNVTTV